MNLAFCWLTLFWILSGAISAGAADPAVHYTYTVTDLGLLPTRGLDSPPGLNAAGNVAAWRETAEHQCCATLTQAGHAADLAPLPGNTITFASDLNNTGMVVGLSQSPEDLRHTHAVSWRQGKMHSLSTLGGQYAFASAVNDHGQIVGAAQVASGQVASNVFHATLWQTDVPNGKPEDLGTLGTGDSSRATAINARGDIAGESNTVPGGKGHAFLRLSHQPTHSLRDLGLHDLGLLPGGSLSSATALNDRQEVVGFADLADGDFHAVLWRGGKTTDLGTLGDEPSVALGINHHTQIVGTSAIREDALRAFLWQNGTMTDLNTRLAPSAAGWLLLTAYQINDRGQILCRGSFQNKIHLCLLTPSS